MFGHHHCSRPRYYFGDRDGGRRRFGGGGHGRGGFPGDGWRGSGGGFRDRGAMRTGRMLGSAELQLLILRLLSEKPRHGYEVIKAIEEHSSGVYAPSPGMVYPALTFLEEMGHAVASAEGNKKLYSITPEGETYLKQQRAAADDVWNQLGAFGRRVSHFQRQFAADEDVADHFGSGARGGDSPDWQQMRSEFRAVRDALKAAIFEKLNASLEEKQRVLRILRRAIDEIRGQ